MSDTMVAFQGDMNVGLGTGWLKQGITVQNSFDINRPDCALKHWSYWQIHVGVLTCLFFMLSAPVLD